MFPFKLNQKELTKMMLFSKAHETEEKRPTYFKINLTLFIVLYISIIYMVATY